MPVEAMVDLEQDADSSVGEVTMTPSQVITIVAESIIALLSIIGNSLVLTVLLKHRKSLWTVTNHFIGSLALADLLVGLVGIPCVLINAQEYPNHFYGCLLMSCIIIILTQISIFCLMGIAVERFLAVKCAVFHRSIFDGRVAWLAILLSWVLGCVVGLVPVFGWHLGYPEDPDSFKCRFMSVIGMSYMVFFNFFGCVLTPLVIMFIIYGYIFKLIRERSQKLTVDTPAAASQRRSLNRESKAAQRIFIILFAFAMCWLPLHILNSVNLFTGYQIVPGAALSVGILLSHANSALNPFLYFYINAKFTNALKSTLGCKTNGYNTNDMKSETSVHMNLVGRRVRKWQFTVLALNVFKVQSNNGGETR